VNFDVKQIRERFPALAVTDSGRPRVYLDNPAGTQVPQQVIDRMLHAIVHCNANLYGNFTTSRQATELSRLAHVAMADFLNAASEREIVFGPNMTTLTFAMTRSLAPLLKRGDEIILTRMEHDGNASPWRIMAEELGLVVRRLDFNRHTYRFDLDQLDALIGERTRFAAINYASNLTGTINDVAEICRRVRAAGGISYVDAVQYAPHGPIDVQRLGADFLVCSAYKFYGPHQGVLWGREEMLERLRPYKLRVSPNALPGRFETGTQSLEGQAGTLGAVEYLTWIGETMGRQHLPRYAGLAGRRRTLHAAMAAIADYERQLSTRLIAGLQRLPGVVIHGITDPALFEWRVPTVSISRPGVDPAALAQALDARGIFVWNGSAYAIDVVEWLGLAEQGGVVRFGPTHYNTVEEIDFTLAALEHSLAAPAASGGSRAHGY
jgi:cysteine desulfurase family protein (TIGR01976 family)